MKTETWRRVGAFSICFAIGFVGVLLARTKMQQSGSRGESMEMPHQTASDPAHHDPDASTPEPSAANSTQQEPDASASTIRDEASEATPDETPDEAVTDAELASRLAELGVVDLENPVCPVMEGDSTGGAATSLVYNGLRLHVCCPPCIDDFLNDPRTSLETLRDEFDVDVPARAFEANAHPPLVDLRNTVSPVSNTTIDPTSRDTPSVVVRGVRIWLAQEREIADVLEDPERAFESLAAAGASVPEDRRRP